MTGVQTCALPIYYCRSEFMRPLLDMVAAYSMKSQLCPSLTKEDLGCWPSSRTFYWHPRSPPPSPLPCHPHRTLLTDNRGLRSSDICMKKTKMSMFIHPVIWSVELRLIPVTFCVTVWCTQPAGRGVGCATSTPVVIHWRLSLKMALGIRFKE